MTAASLATGAAALDLMVRATLLIGAAWAAAAMLNRLGASAAARHLAWLSCIAGLLALPLVWWLAPPLRLPILPLEAAAAAPATPVSSGAFPVMAASGVAGNGESIATRFMLAVYLIGVAMLLLRLASSHVRISRLWRDAVPMQGSDWQNQLYCLLREMRLSRPVELRISRRPVMPMTWGQLAPKILLPAEAHGWSPDRRRFVLLHELAHVARHDSLSRTAASLVCGLYWFHPGVWFAARRMRLEQEHAADDRLLMLGAPARGYALSLLELARRVRQGWPDHAAAMAGACQLERRVLAITMPARRDRPGFAFLALAAFATAFVMLVTATIIPVRRLSEPLDAPSIKPVSFTARSMPAAAERRASEPETAFPRDDARPQDVSGRVEAQGVAPPARPMPDRSQQAGQVPIGSPTPAPAASRGDWSGRDMPNVLLPAPQREVYGPRLLRPIAAERPFDPRIPEPLRSRNPRPPPQDDYAAGRTTGHRIVRGVLRVLPAFLMGSDDSMP